MCWSQSINDVTYWIDKAPTHFLSTFQDTFFRTHPSLSRGFSSVKNNLRKHLWKWPSKKFWLVPQIHIQYELFRRSFSKVFSEVIFAGRDTPSIFTPSVLQRPFSFQMDVINRYIRHPCAYPLKYLPKQQTSHYITASLSWWSMLSYFFLNLDYIKYAWSPMMHYAVTSFWVKFSIWPLLTTAHHWACNSLLFKLNATIQSM